MSSRFSKQSFFYQQKKRLVSSRRVKKHIDTQSVIGDKREPILVFRPGAGVEEDLGSIRLQAKSPAALSHRQRRPSSAAPSKKSSVWFPPIDPTGPHLTTSKHITVEEPFHEEAEEEEKQANYKFDEIKIASTSILSNLARQFQAISNYNISELEVPESLVNILIQSFHQLVADTILEKREWQTDCYLDYYKPNKNKLFLTDTPLDGDPNRQKVETLFNRFLKQAKKKKAAKSHNKKMTDSATKPERPLTAKSTASAVSIKSEASNLSETDSRVEYDKLPPELRTQGPEILRHRRESMAPKPKIPGPRTRLEKFTNMRQKTDRQQKMKGKRGTAAALGLQKLNEKDATADDKDNESTVQQNVKTLQTINFSMSSKDCADNGWIVHPSKTTDPEGFTLYQWATTKLQEALRQREESYLTAKLRGEDGPLIVKYYSGSHYKPLRSIRHTRAESYPLQTILSKLPPSLAVFTSHAHSNDVFLSSVEGQLMCLLILPDGSGFCNYYSGRRAISMSRKGDGSRGLYVVVFDDSVSNNVMAYFMPDGRACCYHRNNSLHLIADSHGGLLMDEDGMITRQWSWPKNGERMPYSISIQLNTHLLLHASDQYQMVLKFSCHGQMHRFPVGLKPDFNTTEHRNESFWIKKSSKLASAKLQTNLPFQSDAAKKLVGENVLPPQTRQSVSSSSKPLSREAVAGRDSGRLKQQLQLDDSLNTSLTGSLTKCDSDQPSRRELDQYRSKIRSVVEEWLNYYRQTIGISPPSRLSCSQQGAAVTNAAMSLLSAANTRLSSSSFVSAHGGVSRSSYPLQQSSFIITRATTPATANGMPNIHEDSMVNIRAESTLEKHILRPQTQDSTRKPFRVGPAKPRTRLIRFRPGCPLSLHAMILRKSKEMPQCRCDKRRIPLIRDMEFDLFLNSHVPPGQLVIVFVTRDSTSTAADLTGKGRSSCSVQPLLSSLHEKQNANRYIPCQQSGSDIFRILKYDLRSSMDDLSTTEALLVSRHNVTAGMFLMYMGGKLIGIYTGFNGYGTTKKDFLKQIQQSLENGSRGRFLPNDFKFIHSSVKQHSTSLWAYPVSGILDELVSRTPSSLNSSSTHNNTPNDLTSNSPPVDVSQQQFSVQHHHSSSTSYDELVKFDGKNSLLSTTSLKRED